MTTRTIPDDAVYYTGDVANDSGWFVITDHCRPGYEELGEVTLTELTDDEEPRVFPWVSRNRIGDVYRGHCDPRFVTRQAWLSYRRERVAAAQRGS